MVALLAICVVSIIIHSLQVQGEQIGQEYDQSLGEYLQEILENFREHMKEGIPEVGIPSTDPLVITDIDEEVNEDIVELILRMKNITIEGLSKFHINYLDANLVDGYINASFDLPRLQVNGYCYMNGKVLSIFPIRSDGNFSMDVEDIHISGLGLLHLRDHIDKDGNKKVKVRFSDLYLDLNFGQLDVNFENVLGGGQWTQTLTKIMTGVGRGLFRHFHEQAMKAFDDALLKLFNKELDRGSIDEILGNYFQ